MRTKFGMAAAALLVGASMLAAPAFAQSKPKITMIVYTGPGLPFFNPVLQGAKDAAAEQGVDLDIQYGNNDQVTENNLIQTAMANKVAGIALSIWDDKAFHKNICAAVAAGIPVVAFNVDNSKGAAASCRQAYIGQDFVDAGYVVGKRLIQTAHLGKGDLVFTPVEFPDAVYATLRHQGVQKALDEVGAKSEIVGTTGDPSGARTAMVPYLIGHPDTKAILALGLEPLIEALPALKEAKMDLPVAGFDLSPEVLDGIKAGKITATVDQQPYAQGFYAITELALEIKYGLYPADVKTGGSGLVDKTNYEAAVKFAGTYR